MILQNETRSFRRIHQPYRHRGMDFINQVDSGFMELNDREKVLCATYMLKKEARYWWEVVKARRKVQTISWTNFEEEFN